MKYTAGICLLLLLLFSTKGQAQNYVKPKTRILFLLDASGSMYATMDKDIRINVAKRLLSKIIDSLERAKDVQVALRVYGHISSPSERNCKDTRLEVPFKPGNHRQMKDKIKDIVPKGTTLIAYSLQQAAYDFPKEQGVRNIIILITDGIEECDGDPCAVSEALQSQGVVLRPFIIGLGGTDDFRKAFECVGRYYDANTEASFNNVLNVVITQALNSTTAQVNLLDINLNPAETNVNMSFYDEHSGQLITNLIHTMNARGFPDTILLDPIYRYRMVVHTIPPVEKKNIEITAGRHNIIAVDAAQGNLLLKLTGITNYPDLKCIVRSKGTMNTLHLQNVNTNERYLVGKYDLEVLTLPRQLFKDVSIDQNTTTTIEMAQPGRLFISAFSQQYIADIYQMNRNELVWLARLPAENKTHNVIMQPGKYKIIYRARNSTKANQTFEREFIINSGLSTNFNLN
ncbi:MAG: VWA domain-containing protein [Bacteroidetes bacterium]|nr:MAG: VWA domain-containing protein [Bacteroidota bacterium]